MPVLPLLVLQLKSCVDCSGDVKEKVAGGGGTGAQYVGNGSQRGRGHWRTCRVRCNIMEAGCGALESG